MLQLLCCFQVCIQKRQDYVPFHPFQFLLEIFQTTTCHNTFLCCDICYSEAYVAMNYFFIHHFKLNFEVLSSFFNSSLSNGVPQWVCKHATTCDQRCGLEGYLNRAQRVHTPCRFFQVLVSQSFPHTLNTTVFFKYMCVCMFHMKHALWEWVVDASATHTLPAAAGNPFVILLKMSF